MNFVNAIDRLGSVDEVCTGVGSFTPITRPGRKSCKPRGRLWSGLGAVFARLDCNTADEARPRIGDAFMRDARYALWGTALLLSLIAPPALAGFAGSGWEASQWAGYAGALTCIALAGSPVRPRGSTPPALVSLRLHTSIGWLALLAVALHVGGLLLADRTVIEYLKPTAPLYQVAGIAATLVLLALALTGGGAARRRLWTSHRSFQATHVILGSALAVLVATHVIATARY